MPTFMVTTVGCKVNQYESQAVGALLANLGLTPAPPAAPPNGVHLLVVNTCCVTSAAAAKSRRAIRRARRSHPNADILVIGCCASARREIPRLLDAGAGEGQVRLAGHSDDIAACLRQSVASLRERLGCSDDSPRPYEEQPAAGPAAASSSPSGKQPHLGGLGRSCNRTPAPAGLGGNDKFMRAINSRQPSSGATGPANDVAPTTYMRPHKERNVKDNCGAEGLGTIAAFAGHQRAFVKVQDGCDAFCSYCIIPHLRRRLWSRRTDEIVAEIHRLVGSGHKEVVLCGVSLGAFGRGTTDRRTWDRAAPLAELLERASEVAGLWRVRLSSLHPADVTGELLDVFRRRANVAAHLHLPLQSGSAAVLKRMGRRYRPQEFLDAAARFAQVVERPAITTDVIVGFPGESDADFAATLDVARQVGFSKIHIFPFSAREGTPAWQWRREGPAHAIIKPHCEQLVQLEAELAGEFRRQFVGEVVEVLVERRNTKTPSGCSRGHTDRYLEVTFDHPGKSQSELIGQIAAVRISAATETGLTGTLVETAGG